MNSLRDAVAYISALAGASQHDRLLRMDFPRNDGPSHTIMLANSFDGDEGLSRDFRYTVEVLSADANIALTDVTGKMVTISLVRDDGSLRYFNGYVFAFRFLRTDGGFAFYEMLLRPWLAFLELRHDCATFQRMTLTEICEKTFEHYLCRDYRFHLSQEEDDITLAIQYNESDFNHLHRRWEAAGLHYWYEHRYDGHTLILSDDSTLAETVDGESCIEYRSESGTQEADGIHAWKPARQLASALYTVRTYEFKNARADWADRPSLNRQGAVPELERHEYTGAHGFTAAKGEVLAQLRMQQIDGHACEFGAESNHRAVQPGRRFSLTGHFRVPSGAQTSHGDGYLITAVRHHATNNYQAQQQVESRYRNTFTCALAKLHWRPARGHNSSDTRIFGVQTATVVGPKGEEIWTDEYGRVRVQFHWDRAGNFDERSSPWVRVMSASAGSSFGHISLPRIGQEVVVQFLDGNCDRPLIIGSVYNAANMPPWDLPANRTQSGILSRSTLGGKPDNANALRFEDKKGQEEVWLHAERDQRVEVEHDESHWVGQDRRKTIGRDETVQVQRNRTEIVEGNETITIRQHRCETVEQSETIEIGEDRTESVEGSEAVRIGGHKKEDVGRTKRETIALAKMLNVGAAYQVAIGAAMNTTVGLSQTSQVGVNKTIDVGRSFAIRAGDEVSIEVGLASLRLRSDGTITLTGTRINIGASGIVHIDGENVNINSGGSSEAGGSSASSAPDIENNAGQAKKTAPLSNEQLTAVPHSVQADGWVSDEAAGGKPPFLRADNGETSTLPVDKIQRALDPTSPFGKEKQLKIIAALDKERELVLGKMRELDRWGQSDRDKFFDSFGTDSEEARKFIRTRLETIAQTNAAATIKNFANAYPDAGDSEDEFNQIYAKVDPDDPERIVKLGPAFWRTPDQHGNTAEGTLAHEHSHFTDPNACIPYAKEEICYSIDGVVNRKTGAIATDEKTGQPLTAYGLKDSALLYPTQTLYHADTISYYVDGKSLPRKRKP